MEFWAEFFVGVNFRRSFGLHNEISFFFGVNFEFIFSNDDGLCGILGSGFQLIQSNLLELVSFEAWHCYCCVNL